MTKTRLFAAVFAAFLLLVGVMFMGNAPVETPVEAPVETPAEPVQSNLVTDFIAELKAKYGEEWQTYYDAIIAEWGTVEQYLLSLVPTDAPDVVKEGWDGFVAWLGEYSPIWGSILAAIFVIIVALFGKAVLHRVKDFFAQLFAKIGGLFSDANKKSKVMMAQTEALLALMGENPKFSPQRDKLKEANKEMGEYE